MNRTSYLRFCFVVAVLFFVSFFAYRLFPSKKETRSENQQSYFKNYESESAPNAPFFMPSFAAPAFPERICDIRKYGAVEGGKILNTEAFKKSIEDCSQKGGGYVIVPGGKWFTGAIHLKSNINLHFEDGAEIIFSDNRNDYLPAVFTRFQGIELYNFSPLIYARDSQNIALTGNGKLLGNGNAWIEWSSQGKSDDARDRLFDMSVSGAPVEQRNFGDEKSSLRPSFVQFVNCKNVLLEDIYVEDGPMWTIHPIYSENIIIRKVKINTSLINTDGVVVDSSKNIYIKDTDFSTGDDSIAIKSGLEKDGFRINRPSENVIISNCRFTKGHGALAIGSELSGGVRNILFENSKIIGNDNGFRVKTTDSRGGFAENIWVNNLDMQEIANEVIVFDTDYHSKLGTKTKRGSAFKNINMKNIYAKNLSGKEIVLINGSEKTMMEGILFENINLNSKGQINISRANGVIFKNISLENTDRNSLLRIKNSTNIEVKNLTCRKTEGICVSISGDDSRNINLTGNSFERSSIMIDKSARNAVLIK